MTIIYISVYRIPFCCYTLQQLHNPSLKDIHNIKFIAATCYSWIIHQRMVVSVILVKRQNTHYSRSCLFLSQLLQCSFWSLNVKSYIHCVLSIYFMYSCTIYCFFLCKHFNVITTTEKRERINIMKCKKVGKCKRWHV